MRLIVSFSARTNGNCAAIARFIANAEDRIVHYASLCTHACAGCGYECFTGGCLYQADDVNALYRAMAQAEQTILLVPMYGGNPSSLYFAFCERGQGFFADKTMWDAFVRKLYIIGIYGSAKESPDFVPCLQKWFAGTSYHGRVLGLERHVYGQKMQDSLRDVQEVRTQIAAFLQSKSG